MALLPPGTWLVHYEILNHIGSGGMGEVYRARDNKLARDVALKVLPQVFASDPDRVLRFRREAQLLASLNHPNIGGIYGVEEDKGIHFLVLELVLGDTLRDRLAKTGALPVEEVLGIGKQIAEGLEHAHAKPIVHRDLKPANLKLTPEGKVKVLDFGLAKAFATAGKPVDPIDIPTGSLHGTLAGTVLGTPAYMPPEQASGKEVDKRADLWALGAVLFELLTGKHAFPGETITEIIASVLKSDPDWTALPADTPPAVRSLLRRCLRKDLLGRFHDPADVRIAIEEALSPVAEPSSGRLPRLLRRWAAQVSAAALAVGIVFGGFSVWNFRPSELLPTPAPPLRLTVSLPLGEQLGVVGAPSVALSPDGSQLAYVGRRGGAQQLYVRALDNVETKPIPGTEGAVGPFFSPDGQWIAFSAQGRLKKVTVSGASIQTLSDSSTGIGGSWGPDDTIFFSPLGTSGLWKVPAAGGQPQEVTKLDRSKGEFSHRFPQMLPGGRVLLFTAVMGLGWDESQIVAQVLETGERRVLVQGGTVGRYVPPGYLVYVRAGTLLAVPFDLARLEVTDRVPVSIAEEVAGRGGIIAGAQYASSAIGTMAYIPASPRENERRLVWVDRTGNVEPLPSPPRVYQDLALSPDGRQVVARISSNTVDLWMLDLTRGTLTRLTSEGSSQSPVITQDGKRIIYRGTRQGFQNLFWKAVDGTGGEERLTTSEEQQTPESVSPDGKFLAFVSSNPTTGLDIWVLPLEGDRKPEIFLRTQFNEGGPVFSPDGRWLAYVSTESGRDEVYVQPFPGPGGKWQVSAEGGTGPRWAHSGRELFYRNGDKMMVVEITATASGFSAGRPRLLFELALSGNFNYDLAPDGQRFLMTQSVEPEQPATQINVVLNWFEELKRRVPAAR